MTKMTKSDLATMCSQEFDAAQSLITEIQDERKESLQRYNQEPFGNEEDGLSKFVASDVRDVIEWQMPQLCDVFVGGDTPVLFEAEGEDDVTEADVESQYCQYVFERQNNGIILFAVWVKDALMQKNGIVKVFRDKTVMREREEYENQTSMAYLELQNDDEFEITEVSIFLNEKEYDEKEFATMLAALPSQAEALNEAAQFHIVGYRKSSVSQTVIENVPPENFVIQKNHNSIFPKDALYACDFYEKTRSQLMEMGYDKDVVYALPASTGIAENAQIAEKQARLSQEGGVTASQSLTDGVDKSRELVMIYDHYIRADFNGDGFAETRHVRMAGKGGDETMMLENEEVDRNPYHAITPYINAYRFYGRSVADNLIDITRMKTQLWRNGLDNVAYSAIPRKIIKGNVDVKALMTFVQGGVIKADMNASVENDVTPFVADTALLMADKVDSLRAERTGFSKETMGLSPDALSNANNPVAMAILSQSQLLTKMMATIIAASGFKTMMEHIRELTRKYEPAERVFDLTGKQLKTNPRNWRKKRNSTVKVGIGFAGKAEELATLGQVVSMQEKLVIAQGGINGALIEPTNIFNAATRLCRRMGIKDGTTYFRDPATYQPPPPQPTIADKTLQAQIDNLNNQQTIKEAEQVQKVSQLKMENELKIAELEQKERIAMREIEARERMHEQELLYKYGKDAHQRTADEIKGYSGNKDGAGQGVNVNVNDQTDAIKEISSDLKTGLSELAKTQADGNEKLLTEIKRKKTIKRNKDGLIEGVE